MKAQRHGARVISGAVSLILALSLSVPAAIAADATTTDLTVPANAYAFAPTVLSAQVNSCSPCSGAVRFSIWQSGGTPGTVDATVDGSGLAQTTISDFWDGHTYNVTATYLGTVQFAPSTSVTEQIAVTKELLSLSIHVDTPTISSGDSARITATVDPAPATYPDQTQVHFSLLSHGQSARYDANVDVNAAGVATLVVPSTSLIPEVWNVTAWFGPTRRYAGTDYVHDTLRYEPVPPQVDLDVTPIDAYPNDEITITATVSPAPGGGSIELFEVQGVGQQPISIGTKSLGAGDTVTFKRTFQQNEGLQLQAVFSGTATKPRSQSPVVDRHQIIPPLMQFTNAYGWFNTHTAVFDFKSGIGGTTAVSVECQLDDGSWYGCVSPATVNNVPDGDHTFSIRGTDSTGHAGYPEVGNFQIDTTAPVLQILINGGATWTNSSTVQIGLTVTDLSKGSYANFRMLNALIYDADEPELLDHNGDTQFRDTFNWNITNERNGGTLGDGLKTVYAQVQDVPGWWSAIASASIRLDTGNPSAPPPTGEIALGHLGSSVPLNLTWPDPTDSLSGVASTNYQRKVGTGKWQPLSVGTGLKSSTEQLATGSLYQYHQRATDQASNVSSWSNTLVCRAVLRQENATTVTRSGTWTRKALTGASGNHVYRSSNAGSVIQTTFTGSSIGWVGTKGPTMGKAALTVDGVTQTIDLYGSRVSKSQIVWAKSWATTGPHTVSIKVLGTAGRPAVDLDAFVVLANQ